MTKITNGYLNISGMPIGVHVSKVSMLCEMVKKADHIDHNTLDNRESNLRIVTPQQNKCNRRNVKGFQFDNQANRYQAYITIDRKKKHLGMFATPEEAHNAYLKAKKKYHKI